MNACSSRVALVVPTIRENSFRDFVLRWNTLGLFDHVDLIVMEDNPKKTFDIAGCFPNDKETGYTHWAIRRGGVIHLCWEDIESDLGEKSWIIPRRSDTVRSYAYYYAWKQGYVYILTLDDDCYPPTKDNDVMEYDDAKAFVDFHVGYLTKRTRWFNTLNSVKPRGIPFYDVGVDDRTIVNHGLWTNVLDYDAPYQLANPIPEKFSFDNHTVPAGSYFPMCGMNVMWKAEATVLMYHLLMGQIRTWLPTGFTDCAGDLNKLPFDRFGDIWCGIIMKKIADAKGYRVSTGMPYIRHERASNPFTNLKKEANGIEVNEKLWRFVDRAPIPPESDFSDCYYDMGEWIEGYNDFPEHREYFKKLGKAMKVWATLFTKEPTHDV